MSGVCPECGAKAPWNAVAGKPYACPSCMNPVMPVERAPTPEASPAPVAPPPPPPSPAPAATHAKSPWMVALLSFLVLGAAYVGVYRLLTAEARRDRDEILKEFGGDGVENAPEPAAAPSGRDTAEIRVWDKAHKLFMKRTDLEQRNKLIDGLFTGLIGAFVLQTILTGAILIKIASRDAKAATGRSGRAPRRGTPPPST